MKFTELNPQRQEQLISLATAYYALKGENPEKKIVELKLKDKKNSTWRNRRWWFMKGIDSHRERMGLSKIYSE